MLGARVDIPSVKPNPLLTVLAGLLWVTPVLAPVVSAQSVTGPWVDVAEQNIERHRKADLRVIVLDGRQRAAAGASVRVEQVRHDFPLGVVVDGPRIDGYDERAELFRCFNAVSLRRLTAWPRVQPDGPADFDFHEARAAVSWAEAFGLDVHWGGVVAADPAHQPEWAVALGPDARLEAAARLIDAVGYTFGGRVRSAALYTHGLDQPWLGEAALRWLFNHAKTSRNGLDLRLGYEQALTDDRGRRMLLDADGKRMSFVRTDGVTVEHAFVSGFARGPLDRVVQRLGRLELPTIVDGLEVGGESAFDAPQNLETVLIMLFGEPSVDAIYFAGLAEAQLRDPAAALVDAEGDPTSCGLVVDRLFRQRWWTDEKTQRCNFVDRRIGDAALQLFPRSGYDEPNRGVAPHRRRPTGRRSATRRVAAIAGS